MTSNELKKMSLVTNYTCLIDIGLMQEAIEVTRVIRPLFSELKTFEYISIGYTKVTKLT